MCKQCLPIRSPKLTLLWTGVGHSPFLAQRSPSRLKSEAMRSQRVGFDEAAMAGSARHADPSCSPRVTQAHSSHTSGNGADKGVEAPSSAAMATSASRDSNTSPIMTTAMRRTSLEWRHRRSADLGGRAGDAERSTWALRPGLTPTAPFQGGDAEDAGADDPPKRKRGWWRRKR